MNIFLKTCKCLPFTSKNNHPKENLECSFVKFAVYAHQHIGKTGFARGEGKNYFSPSVYAFKQAEKQI